MDWDCNDEEDNLNEIKMMRKFIMIKIELII